MSDNPYLDAAKESAKASAKASNPYAMAAEKEKNVYKYSAIQSRSINKAKPYISPLQGDISQVQPPPDQNTGPISEVVDKTRSALKKSGNTVLDVIEPLDRPRNALATGVKSAYQGEGFVEGASEGFSGDEYTSFQHLLEESFRKEHPVLSTVIGITGDIATDPLTYTPAAVIKLPVKAAKGVAKVTGISNVAQRIADTGPLRAFNYYVGDPKKAKELADRYRRLVGGTRYEIPAEARRMDEEIRAISDELGVPPEELKATIVDSIETGAQLEGKAGKFAEGLRYRNREMLELERELGVEIGDLGPTYMAHVLTPEGHKAIDAAAVKDFLSPKPTKTHPSAQMRKLEGTVAEINAKGLYGTEKLFRDDPVIIMAVREMRHAQVMAGARYLDDAKTQFGVPAKGAPEGYIPLEYGTAKGAKNLTPGFVYEPNVAKALNASYGKISAPEEMNKVMRLYDSVQTWWKMWSLGARPAYHSRNVVGNVWNAYLGGLDNPDRYMEARKLQLLIGNGDTAGKQIAGFDADMVYQTARDNGILGRGQYHADLHLSIEKELSGSSKNPLTLSTQNPILQKGFEIGQGLETNARLALYIDRLKKGDSVEDAAKHVNKYLFDYDDLSPFEEQVMKRAFPFYTWTRKNIPLQLQAIVESPDKIQKMNILRHNIQEDVDVPDPEYVQDYILENGPIYFGKGEEGDIKKVFTLMNYHPIMDINRLLHPSEMIKGLTSPIIKAPFEYFVNYDHFRDKEVKEYEGQTKDWFGIRMPVHMAHLASNLVMLNEIDRANPFNVFGESSYEKETGERTRSRSFGMEEELGFTVPENIPYLGGESLGIGAMREERTDLPGLERWLQYLFGVRAYSVDVERGESQKIFDFKSDLLQLRKIMKRAAIKEKPTQVQELEAAIERLVNEFDEEQ